MHVMHHTSRNIESMYTRHGESELLDQVAEKLSNRRKQFRQVYDKLLCKFSNLQKIRLSDNKRKLYIDCVFRTFSDLPFIG